MLIDHKTKWPTRKLAAVIIAGMVTGGAQAAIQALFPGYSATELLAQIDIWVQAGVMAGAGYLTRDKV